MKAWRLLGVRQDLAGRTGLGAEHARRVERLGETPRVGLAQPDVRPALAVGGENQHLGGAVDLA